MNKKYLILCAALLFIAVCFLSKDNIFFGAGFTFAAGAAFLASNYNNIITSKK